MSKKRVVVTVDRGPWVQELLPGLEERAERGAVVVITSKSIRVDRVGERLYDKGEAEEGEGPPE